MSLITLQNVSFSYGGNIAVRNLNFALEDGDYLCIVGENGSGKSTLVKGLLGLGPTPKGRVIKSADLKMNEIGYLPQQKAAQKDFPASVHEVVLSGRLARRGIRPFYSKADKLAVAAYLDRLGIAALSATCYRELSGGQQQRVLLARALCAAEKLLFLDEPISALDPTAAHEMYQLIAEINRENGIAVVMVSHDVKSAVPYARHILHLNTDQLFFGTPDEYAASVAGSAFLGNSKQGGAPC